MSNRAEKLDDYCYAVYLEVPGSQVVKLQGFFEIYEGVGTVRTIDIKNSLVAILTTPNLLEDCFEILEAIKTEVPWRLAENVSVENKTLILRAG